MKILNKKYQINSNNNIRFTVFIIIAFLFNKIKRDYKYQ